MTDDRKSTALKALSLMDLTSLNKDDTPEIIRSLCRSAETPAGSVAAVCVYPEYVALARELLAGSPVAVATVTNFPDGSENVEASLEETLSAVAAGAHEIDVVFPYRALLAGNEVIGADLVAAHRKACPAPVKLKVIIESGELKSPELIRAASLIAIENGADFIKTSTGKVPLNATPEAARIMLGCIRESARPVGFKAAGGVRTLDEAAAYLAIAEELMGAAWIRPEHFRFGASSLLGSLLQEAGISSGSMAEGSY